MPQPRTRETEAKIDRGRVVAKEPHKLPEKGSASLTILRNPDVKTREPERPIGPAKGKFVVPDDFNDPLPEEILRDFAGR
jgi:hypothetical protein